MLWLQVVGSHLCDIGNVVASQKFSKVSDSATTTQMVAVSNTISNVASGSDSVGNVGSIKELLFLHLVAN